MGQKIEQEPTQTRLNSADFQQLKMYRIHQSIKCCISILQSAQILIILPFSLLGKTYLSATNLRFYAFKKKKAPNI